jgi:type I restriction enzyme, S subunit
MKRARTKMSVEETEAKGEEWREGVLFDLVLVNPDKGSATSKIPSFRYIDISCISTDGIRNPHEIPVVLRADAPSRAQRLVRSGDSLVGTVRPERGARGLVPDDLDGNVASTGICVLRPKVSDDAEYVYAVVRDEAFTEWCVNHETGTSYPAVSPQDIGRYPLLVPPAPERARISNLLSTLDATIAAAKNTRSTIERLIVGECQAAFDERSKDDDISLNGCEDQGAELWPF